MNIPRQIYAIQHNKTKRLYIGSSCDSEARYWAHIYALRAGRHRIEDFQADFDKFGEDFSFFILDDISSYSEKDKEYFYMRKYESFVRGKGYNYRDNAVNLLKPNSKIPFKDGKPEIKR